MTTVDERILAELNNGWPFSTRVYAIQAVVELHKPDETGTLCSECEYPDPCETKLVLARRLGVLSAAEAVHIRHTPGEVTP